MFKYFLHGVVRNYFRRTVVTAAVIVTLVSSACLPAPHELPNTANPPIINPDEVIPPTQRPINPPPSPEINPYAPQPPAASNNTTISPRGQAVWDKLLEVLEKPAPAANATANQSPPAPSTTSPNTTAPNTTVPVPVVPAPPPVAPAQNQTPPPPPPVAPALNAARGLKGTWTGNGVSYYIDGGNGQRIIRINWRVTLDIIEQTGDDVVGRLTMIKTNQENLVPNINIVIINFGPDEMRGKIGGTSLTFTIDDWQWLFTFTTDLMSGHFIAPGPGSMCDPKAFTLMRQQ